MGFDEAILPVITDETMRENLGKTRLYSLVVLRKGPGYGTEQSRPVIWEHGRRNMRLMAADLMPLVGPVAGGESGIVGISVLAGPVEETRATMAGDPAVAAGIFHIDVYEWRSFPGSTLPE